MPIVLLIGAQYFHDGQVPWASLDQMVEAQPAFPGDTVPTGQMPTAATWPQFLDTVRQSALAHTNVLPDFVCTQQIKRLAKFGVSGSWALVDQIVTEISYYGNREHSKILTIDNKPPSSEADALVPGFFSEGDFGNALYLLFAPESGASFVMEGSDQVNKRKTVRARFFVPQAHSRYRIGLGDQAVTTAYGGRCWIDLNSHRVVRLESEAREIPRATLVKKASHLTEYDLVEIAGIQHWLPVRASVQLQIVADAGHQHLDFYKAIYGKTDPWSRGWYSELHAQNEIEYRNYRKFNTETRLITDQK
jgi:hypothetical protein